MKDMDEDTIIHRRSCLMCNAPVVCTLGNASRQGNYGGNDYEDGGEGGAEQCEKCMENDESYGMYITGLCTNDPKLDSGKFHNHCSEYPDFGICIYDYRHVHCPNCDEHFFSGLSDLPCHRCGARYGEESKIQNLASMPKPAASCLDGKIEGANDQMTMMRTIAGNIFENAG